MLEPGFSVRSPRGTVVEVLDNRPERFALRRHLPASSGRTAPHRHLEDAVERFTLLEGEATVIEHAIEPRVAFVETYFPMWLDRLAEGKIDRQEELKLIDILAVLDAAGGDTWIAGPPIPVQRVAARVGSRLARLRR